MKKVLLLILCAFSQVVQANDLQLSRPILYAEHDELYAIVNVSWKNAWHNERNHDAVWLFF